MTRPPEMEGNRHMSPRKLKKKLAPIAASLVAGGLAASQRKASAAERSFP